MKSALGLMTAITPLKCLTSDKCSLISAPDRRLLAQICVILTVITREIQEILTRHKFTG